MTNFSSEKVVPFCRFLFAAVLFLLFLYSILHCCCALDSKVLLVLVIHTSNKNGKKMFSIITIPLWDWTTLKQFFIAFLLSSNEIVSSLKELRWKLPYRIIEFWRKCRTISWISFEVVFDSFERKRHLLECGLGLLLESLTTKIVSQRLAGKIYSILFSSISITKLIDKQ